MRFRCDIEQGDVHGYKDEDSPEKSSAAWVPNKNGKEINVRMYSEDGKVYVCGDDIEEPAHWILSAFSAREVINEHYFLGYIEGHNEK